MAGTAQLVGVRPGISIEDRRRSGGSAGRGWIQQVVAADGSDQARAGAVVTILDIAAHAPGGLRLRRQLPPAIVGKADAVDRRGRTAEAVGLDDEPAGVVAGSEAFNGAVRRRAAPRRDGILRLPPGLVAGYGTQSP